MPGVAGTPVRAGGLRRGNFTFYDFSTAGGLTVTDPALSVATGHVTTQGVRGVRLQWTGATSGQQCGVRYQPATAWNWNEIDTFGFEFDFSDDVSGASLAGMRVIFANTTGSGYTQYWTKLANTGTVKYGRRILWLNKSDFTAGAGTPNWNSVARMEMHWQRSTRTTTVVAADVYFKGFYTGVRHQTPTLIWTFDDGDATQYTEAYLGTTNTGVSLGDYGWKGTCYVNSGSIGSAGKMSLANLATLQNTADWDICSHTDSHIANTWPFTPTISGTTVTLATEATGVVHGKAQNDSITIAKMDPIEMNGTFSVATVADTTHLTYTCPTPEATTSLIGARVMDHITTAALQAEIQTCLDYLTAHGFSRALAHYSYPYGAFSDQVISVLQSMGFKTARALSTMSGSTQSYGWTGIGTAPGSLDWFRMPARGLGSSDTAAGVLADIDVTIKYGGCIILYAHNLVTPTAATRDFDLNTEWPALLRGIRQREKMGLLQVMKFRDYYEQCCADGIA